MPRVIEARTESWRLGQTAIAGMIALVLVIEVSSSMRAPQVTTPALLLGLPIAPAEPLAPQIEAEAEQRDADVEFEGPLE